MGILPIYHSTQLTGSLGTNLFFTHLVPLLLHMAHELKFTLKMSPILGSSPLILSRLFIRSSTKADQLAAQPVPDLFMTGSLLSFMNISTALSMEVKSLPSVPLTQA